MTKVQLDAELIGAVCERVAERVPAGQVRPCTTFVQQYYQWVPSEDLAERSSLDLYGAAVAHWNLSAHRPPGTSRVHVYNPDFEQHGWQSPHTVVEIVTDDMPFLVDSVTMQLAHGGHGIDLVIHPVIHVRRDEHGTLLDVIEQGASDADAIAESILHLEVQRQTDRQALADLRARVERVLEEVRATVEDWQAMRSRALDLSEALSSPIPGVDHADREETREFLRWLTEEHFVFLGYREYDLDREGDAEGLRVVPGSGLGILRKPPPSPFTPLSPKALSLATTSEVAVLTKANSFATVHRPAYLDYIGVKRFDSDGRVVGEYRFLGLYTTATYRGSALEIPKVRGKLRYVFERAGFPPSSHDAKALTEILESYPRDSLFQIEPDELFNVATGILGLGERQRVRLFARRDPLDRFVACLACIPRDRFNTEIRERVGEILTESFNGTGVDWTLLLSESVIARVHYIVHCDGVPDDLDVPSIEARVIAAVRDWSDDLADALVDEYGEDLGTQLQQRYARAFPPAYRDQWVARSAVADIARIEELDGREEPIISLYRPLEAPEGVVRTKLFSRSAISLSDVLPTFEHMGARVIDEQPYEVTIDPTSSVWIYDFGLRAEIDDLDEVRGLFGAAFLGIWRGDFEDDGLGALVLQARLTGRQVTILRAIAKYLRQAGIAFSDRYMELTLTAHPEIALLLVQLFTARLDPDLESREPAELIFTQIERAVDAVRSLDEDRILRSFLAVIRAVLRTNYFRVDGDGAPPGYLSFKLDPGQVPLLPLPRPRFEIFVYSPRVEGVHLRGGSVARGGLRWSDRREDFRTEVLGLMKAQMVKNALIVPVGSKGGFVVKRPPVIDPAQPRRDALQAEGIECYRTFLRGLLDVTDNIVGGEVVPPERVVRYDGDDPYLVVAADKGTASFSDIANGVSAEYSFWLGDAFASGGSQGYDHKQMGITARGAWKSVERHFRELGTNIETSEFTVVGIGDMSGDVFGNGMLLSPHIKLLAAFNHMHVFLDPNPDAAAGYAERQRLFELERSGWSDYNPSLISAGGGVHPRTAKSIKITPEVQGALAIAADELSPTELIRELLRAPVDLLWNGGIGTYVKASAETHADVGDKANDGVRVDGEQLRCRVVGEGGNLGFTQRGRIEYARGGGRINTDAIDNVAGVNCSDHEVNIKILLDALVAAGDLTQKQRNELLVEMTDRVAEKVLYGSYTQTQAMSLALAQSPNMIDVHSRLIPQLERVAGLNRELEFLPTKQTIDERKVARQGLLAPELAVVIAYAKIHLYTELLDSDLPEDPFLRHDLERYFPAPLGPDPARRPASPDRDRPKSSGSERYSEQMQSHRLRREIIATVVANQLVDRAGSTFVYRLGEETGASSSILARGYAVAREVFAMRDFWDAVEELDNQIEAWIQLSMLFEARRLVERSTRWLVRTSPTGIDIEAATRRFGPGARMLAAALPYVLLGDDRDNFDAREGELAHAGVPAELARRVASMSALLAVFDIVEVATASGRDPSLVMATYFRLGSELELTWLRDRIIELPRASRWQALARAALRDDLANLVRTLTQEVLEGAPDEADAESAIARFSERQATAIERCLSMLQDIKASRVYDTTTLPVALREVRNLIRTRSGPEPIIAPVTSPAGSDRGRGQETATMRL
jgi:glutamate dehydrogenase